MVMPGAFHPTDFALLHYLILLLDQRSVSRAAEHAGISQPAMSRILARLRDQFGDALLVRGGNGMMLTPRAEALKAPLHAWLREGEVLLREPEFDPRQAKREFRLASTDFGVLAVVTPALAGLGRDAPGCTLSVEPLSGDSLRLLNEGQLDLVITGFTPRGVGLRSQWLFRETYLGLAPPGHPVLGTSGGCEDLLRWPHVVAVIGAGFDDPLAGQSPEMAARRIVMRAESFSLTPYLVASGGGVAVLPARAASHFAKVHGLRTFGLSVALQPFDYFLVWHERTQSDPATLWLIDALRSAFAAG